MLISKTVKVNWSKFNKKLYISKGYLFTAYDDEFVIKVEDLNEGSHSLVEVKCDGENCNAVKVMEWRHYLKYIAKHNGNYYCNKCNKHDKFISFQEWCLDNLDSDKSKYILSLWDEHLNNCKPSEISYGAKGKFYFKCPKELHDSELIELNYFIRHNEVMICRQCNSFKQWCIENNREDILKRWDYELNECNPEDIRYGTSKKYWFKCSKGIHKSELKNIASFTNGQEGSIQCNQCGSFEQWCIENNKEYILKLWDYELNRCLPSEIKYGTNESFYFKCPKAIHKSELNTLHSIVNKNGNVCCNACNSFAQWGIYNLGNDFLEKYWDYDKNKDMIPWEIDKCSNKKVWIKCQEKDYHGSYEVSCDMFTTKNRRCSYCGNLKIHPLDSLGKLLEEKGLLHLWSDKNKKSPYEYAPYSRQKVYWKCNDDKHEDYYRECSVSMACNFRCANCTQERSESFLQEKVRLYINELGYISLHEYDCSIIAQNPKIKNKRGNMPYDNEIKDLKLVIEVHGKQHYEITGFHYLSATENGTTKEYELYKIRVRDRYKRIYAKSKGYQYLEIPHWTDSEQEEWKQLINNKIYEIKGV